MATKPQKDRKPRFTLEQAEAERMVAAVKNAVEQSFTMPEPGGQNAEFHARDGKGEGFTIAVYRGRRNALRHEISARISRGGVPLLRLCVNGTPHVNPDGERIGGTHWHVYREGEDDCNAYPADVASPDFVSDTILLLDRFHVVRKPLFQEELI